ncbi:hypothetical protein Dimus_019067 [Dionaea muscipula]
MKKKKERKNKRTIIRTLNSALDQLLDDVVPPRRRWRRSKTGESGGVGAEKGSWAPLRWRLMEKMGELDVGGDPDLGEDVGELGALGGGAAWDRRRRWGRSAAAGG